MICVFNLPFFFFFDVLFFNIIFFVKGGRTPLHVAAAKGFEQIVKIFIEHHANVNLQNKVFSFFFILVCVSFFLVRMGRQSLMLQRTTKLLI